MFAVPLTVEVIDINILSLFPLSNVTLVFVNLTGQIHVPLDPPQWTLDPRKLLTSITERTKAIILNRLEITHK